MKEVFIDAKGFFRGISPLGMAEVINLLENSGIKITPIPDVYRECLYIFSEDKDAETITSVINQAFPKFKATVI